MNRTHEPIGVTVPTDRPDPTSRPRALVRGLAVAGLVGALAAVVPVPGAATADASTQRRACSGASYTVARGDGWSTIAKKLGVSTGSLLSANGATVRTVLHPGHSVCAPAGAKVTPPASSGTSGGTAATSPSTSSPTASCSAGTYTVVKGDGWFAIAKKLGVTSKALLAANKATASTPLFAGRTICVPNGATAPAAGTPAAAKPAAVKNLTAAENEAIIRAAWPDELEEEALRIARRESNLRNTARNWCCHGLFQIHWNAHKSWLAGIGVTNADQLLDPTVNANAAYVLYQRANGFGPWKL